MFTQPGRNCDVLIALLFKAFGSKLLEAVVDEQDHPQPGETVGFSCLFVVIDSLESFCVDARFVREQFEVGQGIETEMFEASERNRFSRLGLAGALAL